MFTPQALCMCVYVYYKGCSLQLWLLTSGSEIKSDISQAADKITSYEDM